jgi:hypothetical protein
MDVTLVNGRLAQWVTLGELYDVPSMISQNDTYNWVWVPGCNGPRYNHFDLSPSDMVGHVVKSPVSGEISIFGPDPESNWEGSNITLPPNAYLRGIENAFDFAGYPFDPNKVKSIWVGLGHITYEIPHDMNTSTIDGTVSSQ